MTPRATTFIVTVYGDVVEPRGGTLSMASLIEICADAGIGASLARTAVSRLVAAGRLEGERAGRRAFYRLTDAASDEFRAAGRLIYEAPETPEGWLIALAAAPEGWAPFGPGAIAPGHSGTPLPDGPVLRARTLRTGGIAELAGALWPLAATAEAYRAFLALAPAGDPLTARLLLVHAFRRAVLADPRLPPEALPADWPAAEARAAFARRYLDLTEGAQDRIAALTGRAAPLPRATRATEARLAALRRAA